MKLFKCPLCKVCIVFIVGRENNLHVAATQGNIAVFVCTSLGPLDMTKASVPYDG